MGSVVGKVMEENFKKQQVFMEKNQEVMIGRNLQMQNQMRERQMAMMIARQRDLFHFYSVFYFFVVLGAAAGVAKKKPAAAVPLVPFSVIFAYQYDAAYANKLTRIREEADRIMDDEKHLLALPHGLPTLAAIDAARLEQDDQQRFKAHDLFL